MGSKVRLKSHNNQHTSIFSLNSVVQWKWMGRVIHGTVKETYTETVTKVIKGKTIKRKGSQENPAYLVESEAGNFALKLHSELSAFEKSDSSALRT